MYGYLNRKSHAVAGRCQFICSLESREKVLLVQSSEGKSQRQVFCSGQDSRRPSAGDALVSAVWDEQTARTSSAPSIPLSEVGTSASSGPGQGLSP